MTGSLIIIVIVIVTDIHFYFKNKKQARGELILEPVEGTDSSVSFSYPSCVGRAPANDSDRTSSGTLTKLTGWTIYGCDECTEH